MVDDVCIYHGRREFIIDKYQEEINDLENSVDVEEK
jgi:hypothetical protein